MEPLDISIYYPLPLLSTEGYVSLTKTLLAVAPKGLAGYIQAAIDSLAATLGEAEAGLVARIDDDRSSLLERAFDIVVDRVWYETNSRLEFYEIYSYEGMAKLTDKDRAALHFDDRLDDARTAALIHSRLFGSGTEFLRGRFDQQATHMAARLNWIGSKQLEPKLQKLISPELAKLLEVCQHRYEAMVNERNSRDGKSVASIRELRHKLRRQLYNYCGVLGSVLDPEQPETSALVEQALRPILIVRAQTRRKLADQATDELAEVEPLDEDASLDDGPADGDGELAPDDALPEPELGNNDAGVETL